jgi:O-antigen ligase
LSAQLRLKKRNMLITDKFKLYGGYLYFCTFFFILFFSHKNIDTLRVPFILFILWQVAARKLHPKFFIDPVFIGTALFAISALVSNLINHIPQDGIVTILNWLYPYGLGKYALINYKKKDVETILLLLLGCAALFSIIGIIGYLLNIQTLLGIDLFDWYGTEARYRFTISGTNRAGFYIGVTLVAGCYFFIKNGFKFTRLNVFVMICFPTVFAALFLIKERKTILTVYMMICIFMLLYKKYKSFLLISIAAVFMLMLFPVPERYNLKEMLFYDGMKGRLCSWECAAGLFKEKPILGHGYPSFKKASATYFQENNKKFKFKKFYNWSIAHNLNLNALAETGILGFLGLNCIFFSVWRFYRYLYAEPLLFVLGAVIIFIYITMQFGNFVHSATRTNISFLIFGLYFSFEKKYLSMRREPVEKKMVLFDETNQ